MKHPRRWKNSSNVLFTAKSTHKMERTNVLIIQHQTYPSFDKHCNILVCSGYRSSNFACSRDLADLNGMGGRQSQLTTSLRIASIIAAVLLGVFIYVIRYRAGLVGNVPIPVIIKVASWIITAFMAFNTLGNITSLSINEKLLFSPITFILTVACLLVSASKSNPIRLIHVVQ